MLTLFINREQASAAGVVTLLRRRGTNRQLTEALLKGRSAGLAYLQSICEEVHFPESFRPTNSSSNIFIGEGKSTIYICLYGLPSYITESIKEWCNGHNIFWTSN